MSQQYYYPHDAYYAQQMQQQPSQQQQYAQYPNYQQYPANYDGMCTSPPGVQSWFNFKDGHYLRGFLIGAGVAVLLTNPRVQQAAVKGAVTLWTSAQGAVEELKEKVQDFRAEMSHKASSSDEEKA
ncbi:YtxH domain-containing protein [Oceanidesulfovibrio marinus]|uniref:YtxH domain-containing protein n=1 Tax=Oceanidesulfovibrio marinus TaxID=370038 RepID=A0A6P1ZMK9_9BACT|nr:YtxH domain-containing protein [Oceanidesulfovibrio marinus]QJT09005.1 YtxH domain-containing protein [Oceanidesulfovibrio marinus]TVM36569.1 YtxH domain-containing protein [Oceanidesulfovibrio marinus]